VITPFSYPVADASISTVVFLMAATSWVRDGGEEFGEEGQDSDVELVGRGADDVVGLVAELGKVPVQSSGRSRNALLVDAGEVDGREMSASPRVTTALATCDASRVTALGNASDRSSLRSAATRMIAGSTLRSACHRTSPRAADGLRE